MNLREPVRAPGDSTIEAHSNYYRSSPRSENRDRKVFFLFEEWNPVRKA